MDKSRLLRVSNFLGIVRFCITEANISTTRPTVRWERPAKPAASPDSHAERRRSFSSVQCRAAAPRARNTSLRSRCSWV
jgi:hypothetical protein